MEGGGVDCGDAAGEWLNKFLGKEGLCLAYAAPGLKRRNLKEDDRIGPILSTDDEVSSWMQ